MFLHLLFIEAVNLLQPTNKALVEYNKEYKDSKRYIESLVRRTPYSSVKLNSLSKLHENTKKAIEFDFITYKKVSQLKIALYNKFWLREEFLSYKAYDQPLNSEIECLIALYDKIEGNNAQDLVDELKKSIKKGVCLAKPYLNSWFDKAYEQDINKLISTFIRCIQDLSATFVLFARPENNNLDSLATTDDSDCEGVLHSFNTFITINKMELFKETQLTTKLYETITYFQQHMEYIFVEIITKNNRNDDIEEIIYKYNIFNGILSAISSIATTLQLMAKEDMFNQDKSSYTEQDTIKIYLRMLFRNIRQLNVNMLLLLLRVDIIQSIEEEYTGYNIFVDTFYKNEDKE